MKRNPVRLSARAGLSTGITQLMALRRHVEDISRILGADSDAAHDMWTWLPSYHHATEVWGDYGSEHTPCVADLMREASSVFWVLKRSTTQTPVPIHPEEALGRMTMFFEYMDCDHVPRLSVSQSEEDEPEEFDYSLEQKKALDCVSNYFKSNFNVEVVFEPNP